jgi:GNAT superfamily N-acetyltransferase
VIQISAAMERKGLVVSSKDPSDERRRLLALTPRGRALVTSLGAIWEEVSRATQEVLGATGHDVLDVLSSLERELDREEMYVRVSRRLKERSAAAVEILEYEPRLRRHFRALNLEWLEKEFAVEEHDRRMLSDPEREILEPGGAILFARLDRKIVGTCALIPRDPRTVELAKMAVTESARGRQIGRRLALAAIDKARALGARRIVLQTSPKLAPALGLYRSLGFVIDPNDHEGPARYARPTFGMKLDLSRNPESRSRKRRKAS